MSFTVRAFRRVFLVWSVLFLLLTLYDLYVLPGLKEQILTNSTPPIGYIYKDVTLFSPLVLMWFALLLLLRGALTDGTSKGLKGLMVAVCVVTSPKMLGLFLSILTR